MGSDPDSDADTNATTKGWPASVIKVRTREIARIFLQSVSVFLFILSLPISTVLYMRFSLVPCYVKGNKEIHFLRVVFLYYEKS